ncbi:phosphoenolpyruvate--protein phosphotransferase [Moraxella caviae]|uniref:phosphoenolpyruvate--protein phosphotransferase n=1 Tax=Moraxella caviae TaxID=34060 RepID=A0A1S9ZYI6_9GAMM|nr:phosphoenolpyruvate--protein phosphotransferase [Moraxella caviae]OOR88503.1 phosphoenolpyruvate--protein phosphotransferase [Moraxella caviae]STZ14913.1 Phosphoenolpyruvate-protein phosphotransferase [Moraxella caviae]VEW12721.1 Phosphoenolpyruvate-protein phosphotransferase [Moraxella caviae]
MLTLTTQDVRMNMRAANKQEALSVLAQVLAEDGLTTPDYIQGLQDREAQAATYLGQGIAIPHGTPDSRAAILRTGVRLVHFADGVVWTDAGDVVYLAAVIAAKSDEHLQVLKKLTRALDADVAEKIKTATTPDAIIELIEGEPKSFLAHEALIATDIAAADTDTLYQHAVARLKQQGVFTQDVLGLPLTLNRISQALYVATVANADKAALALGVAKQPFADGVRALAVIADGKNTDEAALSASLDGLLSDEFAQALAKSTPTSAELAQILHAELIPNWQGKSALVLNAHGLHARPATFLSELAKKANGEIKVALENGAYVSAKSLTRLLALGAERGQTLNFIAEPNTDAVAHLDALVAAVADGLGEEVTPITAENKSNTANKNAAQTMLSAPVASIQAGEQTAAVPASAGLAVGEAYVVREMRFKYPMTANNPAEQFTALQDAIAAVKTDLHAIVSSAKSASVAQIFTAHIALLDDEEISYGAKDGIDDGLSAPAAWHAHIESLAKAQSVLSNRLLAERAADLRDVGQKVLAKLTGQDVPAAPDSPYVLIKDDLLPSDVARLDPAYVAGILTAGGGASSHSAIVARALGIPALVGAGKGVLEIAQGEKVLIDGGAGWFVMSPDSAMIERCQHEQAQRTERKRIAHQHALSPAKTLDNHQVEVAANLGNVKDAADVVAQGAEAVGLLRTELVFMAHSQIPDIATQIADYEQVFDALDGRPLVVRTLDIGGDKPLPYLPMPSEDNPFLGVRGVRLTLQYPNLLKDQLTALVRAAKGRDVRIMFPMIGRFEEWQAAKAILDDVLANEPHENVQVGMMIEVPSAAVMAHAFAADVDFFSVGTNDLTQYVLAIDRGHPVLSKDADGLHPSVLNLIHQTVQAAHAHGKWVGVCGELAADEKAVPILLGLGVDELSMSAASIALTKAQIRELDFTECQALAERALRCRTAKEVRALAG